MTSQIHGLERVLRLGAAVVAGLGLLAAPAGAVVTGSQAFKCQSGLAKGSKISNFVEKFVGKCVTDYEKRNLFLIGEKGKGQEALDKSAELCQKFVNDKALAVVNAALDTSGCTSSGSTDDDYLALGLLDETVVGAGTNEKLTRVQALKVGLERVQQMNPDLYQILDSLVDQGPGCPACGQVRDGLFGRGLGPCANYVCGLSSNSSVTINGTIPVAATGTQVISVCDWDPITGNDYALFGSPGRTSTASITLGMTTVTVCVEAQGARGVLLGDGSTFQTAQWATCQDHDTEGTCSTSGTACIEDGDCPTGETCNGSADECVTEEGFDPGHCGAGTFEGRCVDDINVKCGADSDCDDFGPNGCANDPLTDPNVVPNGGACGRIHSASSVAGSALLQTILVNQISSGAGPDGQFCTADDDAAPPAPVPIAFTTEGAQVTIKDNNGADESDVSFSVPAGAPQRFDLVALEGGSLAGGRLVSSFPALNTVLISGPPPFQSDLAVTIELECEDVQPNP